jgi:hypothetical protein
MPKVKWTTFTEVNPEREYFAFANVGERKSVWSYFSLLMGARKVAKQLEATKGAIGVTGATGIPKQRGSDSRRIRKRRRSERICPFRAARQLHGENQVHGESDEHCQLDGPGLKPSSHRRRRNKQNQKQVTAHNSGPGGTAAS